MGDPYCQVKVKTIPFSKYLLLDKKPVVYFNKCVLYHLDDRQFVIAGVRYGDENWHYVNYERDTVEIVIDAVVINYDISKSLSEMVNNHQGFKINIVAKTYIMIDHNTGYFKIGRSKDPKFREATLQSEKPTIQMIAICEDDVEDSLHARFLSKRVRGEWFNLSGNDIKEIKFSHNFSTV